MPPGSILQIIELGWCLNKWGKTKKYIRQSWSWRKSVSILCLIFIVCFYFHVATVLLCLRPVPSGLGYSTHTRDTCVLVCLATFLYMSTVCKVGGRGIAFTAHHLHFHTQFVMSVTRQGEGRGSHRKKMAAFIRQIGRMRWEIVWGEVATRCCTAAAATQWEWN